MSLRLTYLTGVVLDAIAHGHRYGFEIMDVTGLPDGTVYPALRRLERAGMLRARWEPIEVAHREQRPQRRYYELTRAGADARRRAIERFPTIARVFSDAPGPQEAT